MIDRIRAAAKRDVSRETFEQLERFAGLIAEENKRQNIISPGGMVDLWTRHILDGAQLVGMAGRSGSWCDIGSGPGLPGLVIAILGGLPMTLIEPRRLRADFLRRAVLDLHLDNVVVEDCKVERVTGKFDLITARAVASLDRLFGMAEHLAHGGTRWILPKGERAKSELDDARRNWQGRFELVPSQTHEGAAIVVADRIARRRGK
jgi:16S rRNA (guanine527-N7)-methyltransferase